MVDVVVDDVVDVVDEVVDVDAAVVTGMVVLVVVVAGEVVVISATDDDVAALSFVADLSSPPQLATMTPAMTSGRRRVDFTGRSLARGVAVT